MNWYQFTQNNSGGKWKGPAMIVGIEAESEQDALLRAPRYGLYFNGCESGLDCTCCEDRWYTPYEYSVDRIRGYYDSNRFGLRDLAIKWSIREGIPMIALYHASGEIEIIEPNHYEGVNDETTA